MKSFLVLVLVLVLLLSGCASYRLPEVSGDLLEYNRKDPLGGTVIRARGVAITTEKVKAEEATWTTTYPLWSVAVRIVNYERVRKPEAPKP